MFEKQAAAFLYCTSPVHMGAGTATGLVDNPIQRECHTGHPSFAGSGIKGAARHAFANLVPDAADKRDRIFGPETGDDLYAGAISFGDAQLVAFPVRSLREGFVYATCPHALARAARLLAMSGRDAHWPNLSVANGHCQITPQAKDAVTDNGHVDLEVFQYQAEESAELATIGEWLAGHALHDKHVPDYFRNKLRDHLLLLSDTDFDYFVRNATLVEPHVRINEKTGAADSGGLFYTENLPPESLLIAPVMASRERSGHPEPMDAGQVLGQISTALHGNVIQLGGDATTGRGMVSFHLVQGG